MKDFADSKFATIAVFVVVSIVVTGFYVGLQSPMTGDDQPQRPIVKSKPVPSDLNGDDAVVPATHYAEIGAIRKISSQSGVTNLSALKRLQDQMAADEWQEEPIQISPAEKSFSLAMRETIRAFNGAPPTVPHPVDQMSSESCMACHGVGLRTASMRIPKMSHPYLANCTQCHVENNPTHMAAELFGDNTFVGLPAPSGGPRAFPEAPPMIPHSTWMRNECVSCHGPTGNFGIQSTHPWRKNCQQCHAPSSQLDQIPIDSQPLFLPPLTIEN